MPGADPLPPNAVLKLRLVRVMRLAAFCSVVIAAIAIFLMARGDSEIRIHLLIATALGVGVSVLLGIALMCLVFLSNRMGQDEPAAAQKQKDEHDPRS